MTTVIAVPPSLDDQSFEQVLEQLAPLPTDARVLVDARHVRWASPYGLAALLTVAQTRRERPALAVPEHDETASYWARTGFYRHAEELFELHGAVPRGRATGAESSVLLELTPVARSEDVHGVVERIQQRAQQILVKELHLDPQSTMRFAMTLSEACQNIVEHAGTGGWVAVQTYRWQRRLGRRVVVIAVCDAGIGFRQSLESAQGRPRSDRWDDAMALEEAVIRGVSRFRDPGRGQGLAGVRRFIGKWDGKLSVRSGTARIAIVPGWDDDPPLAEGLPAFPGAQMQITIPERMGTGGAAR
ncbi:MAG TPA: ATP-binding protein [Gemmatimonadaceae bacterium]|nr:ATP-binding protein [Gemmatimonadaceae bacterium]